MATGLFCVLNYRLCQNKVNNSLVTSLLENGYLRSPRSSARRYTNLGHSLHTRLHTKTLQTTVNPATAYASRRDAKSRSGVLFVSITFFLRLLHAVNYLSPHRSARTLF